MQLKEMNRNNIGIAMMFFPMAIIALTNYRLFHVLMECLFIMAASVIYAFATWTFPYHRSSFLKIVGLGFLSSALLTFLHLLGEAGFQVAPGGGSPVVYEWSAGLIQAFSMVLALAFWEMKKGVFVAGWVIAFIQGTLLLLIIGNRFHQDVIWGGVAGYQQHVGLCIALFALQMGCIVGLFIRRKVMPPSVYRCTLAATVGFILASWGLPYQSIAGILAHGAKIGGAFIFVCGIVYLGIKSPLRHLFSELKSDAISDALTGLYNRQGFQELASQAMRSADRKGDAIGLLVMDLDNFKGVNDRFGHLVGDEILKHFGRLLQNAVGLRGIPFRLGGDEFLVLVRDAKAGNLRATEEIIRRSFARWISTHAVAGVLGLSIGAAIREPGGESNLERLIQEADANMYREKRSNSRRVLLRKNPMSSTAT